MAKEITEKHVLLYFVTLVDFAAYAAYAVSTYNYILQRSRLFSG